MALIQQKGFATLFVVLVLLITMTTITMIMTRSGMLEQSTNQNENITQSAQLNSENTLEYAIAWLSTQEAHNAINDNLIICPKDSDCPALPTLKGNDQGVFDLNITFRKPIKITVKATKDLTNIAKAITSCTVSGRVSGQVPPYDLSCLPYDIFSIPAAPILNPLQDPQKAAKESLDFHVNWLKSQGSITGSLVCLVEASSTTPFAGLNPICPKPTLPIGLPPIDLEVILEESPFIELTATATQTSNNSKAITSCVVKVTANPAGTNPPYTVVRIPGTWKDWN